MLLASAKHHHAARCTNNAQHQRQHQHDTTPSRGTPPSQLAPRMGIHSTISIHQHQVTQTVPITVLYYLLLAARSQADAFLSLYPSHSPPASKTAPTLPTALLLAPPQSAPPSTASEASPPPANHPLRETVGRSGPNGACLLKLLVPRLSSSPFCSSPSSSYSLSHLPPFLSFSSPLLRAIHSHNVLNPFSS